MRITQQMMTQNVLREIRAMTEALEVARQAAVTGKRIRVASDDPENAAALMQVEHGLRTTEQYRRNSTTARTRLLVEDDVINSARALIQRAIAAASNVASDDPTDPSRQAILLEVNAILQSVAALGNTQVGNEYIFGGLQTGAAPFLSNGTYVGSTSGRSTEVDKGLLVASTHPGSDLFGSTVSGLQSMITELQTGTQASIQATVASLEAADRGVLVSQTEVGARLRQIDDVEKSLGRYADRLLARRDDLQFVDPVETLFKARSAQQALERAYTVIARILNTSLIDTLS